MNNLIGELKNADGSSETLQITSNDNYTNPLDINKTYKLANNLYKKENKFVSKFKNSIFGTEIGVKAEGFTNITILATIIAICALLVMYILWKL